jgi:plasmid replication initiation protein
LSVKDFAKLLEVDIKTKDLYKRVDTMTTHIMQEVIRIGDDTNKKWLKFHWVDRCRYNDGIITIKISEELKPYLIGLRGSFTRYQLSEIISFKSIYAIRIYEILNGYLDENNLPHADIATEISLSIDELRKATDTEKKFERPYDFKKKVIDIAVREINDKSKYHVTATPYKSRKAIVGFDFLIESQVGYSVRLNNISIDDDYTIDGQMNINDFIDI